MYAKLLLIPFIPNNCLVIHVTDCIGAIINKIIKHFKKKREEILGIRSGPNEKYHIYKKFGFENPNPNSSQHKASRGLNPSLSQLFDGLVAYGLYYYYWAYGPFSVISINNSYKALECRVCQVVPLSLSRFFDFLLGSGE